MQKYNNISTFSFHVDMRICFNNNLFITFPFKITRNIKSVLFSCKHVDMVNNNYFAVLYINLITVTKRLLKHLLLEMIKCHHKN